MIYIYKYFILYIYTYIKIKPGWPIATMVKALDLSSNGRMSAWVRSPPTVLVIF